MDVQAATALGVWVAHMRAAATGNAESVAEHALLLLAFSRRLRTAEQGLRQRLCPERTARVPAPRTSPSEEAAHVKHARPFPPGASTSGGNTPQFPGLST
ncbi:hypothetical protein [Stigmatella aurantiaca]|uniref:hypothetical protein n=1 Tax=Stigmatella aurantiaca TaxID=41 RepID=UPI003B2873CC